MWEEGGTDPDAPFTVSNKRLVLCFVVVVPIEP